MSLAVETDYVGLDGAGGQSAYLGGSYGQSMRMGHVCVYNTAIIYCT